MVKFNFSLYKNLQFFFKVIDFLEYTRFASRGYIHDALLESSVLVHTLRAKMESHPSLSPYPFSLLPSPHYLPTYPIGLPSLPSPLAHTATHLAYYETRCGNFLRSILVMLQLQSIIIPLLTIFNDHL